MELLQLKAKIQATSFQLVPRMLFVIFLMHVAQDLKHCVEICKELLNLDSPYGKECLCKCLDKFKESDSLPTPPDDHDPPSNGDDSSPDISPSKMKSVRYFVDTAKDPEDCMRICKNFLNMDIFYDIVKECLCKCLDKFKKPPLPSPTPGP